MPIPISPGIHHYVSTQFPTYEAEQIGYPERVWGGLYEFKLLLSRNSERRYLWLYVKVVEGHMEVYRYEEFPNFFHGTAGF